jgi:hypothetical protein
MKNHRLFRLCIGPEHLPAIRALEETAGISYSAVVLSYKIK